MHIFQRNYNSKPQLTPMIFFQEPLCSLKDVECLRKIKINSNQCLKPCSGLILTSFSKTEPKNNLESLIEEEVLAYDKYMKWFEYPTALKGFNNFRN